MNLKQSYKHKHVTKKKTSLWALLLLLVVATLPQRSSGQVFETRSGVDTLKLSERISFHTNVVDWALLVPNIGLEFDIRNTNWNRWAVGLSFKSRWQTNSTFKQRYFYSLTSARVYFRNYWRTRQISDYNGVSRHTNIIDRAFSCRRTKVKHPRTTYYRGLYASVSDYSYKFSKNGRQGLAFSGGVTYGCLRPLYQFASGNSLDLEMGIDVGLMLTRTEQFGIDADTKCYTRVSYKDWKIVPFPLPTELRLGLVYRLGSYPITKKYRWRQDADAAYADALRERRLTEQTERTNRENAAKTRQKMEAEFWSAYDSIASVNAVSNKQRAVEMARQKAEADRMAADKARADKEAAKKQREAEKTKKAEKAEQKDSTSTAPATTETPADSIANMTEQPAAEEATESSEQPAAEEAEEATESSEQPATEEATESSEQPATSEQPQTDGTPATNDEGKEATDENN